MNRLLKTHKVEIDRSRISNLEVIQIFKTNRIKVSNLEKTSWAVSTEDDILKEFPDAKKIEYYQYIAKKDGWTYFIYNDSASGLWTTYGRTKDNPNAFMRLFNFLAGK